jgi:hypothetical protein
MSCLRPARRLSAGGMVEDQAGNQFGQRHPRLLWQCLPVRRRDQSGVAGAAEQLELLWCWSAWHRYLPESPVGSSMLRSNRAFAMRNRERQPHRAAMPPDFAKPPQRQPASPQPASIGAPPDRTSRREPPAVGRTRHRSGYSETQPSLPSRSHRERKQLAPPKGATGRKPRAPRSRGRSVIELYNHQRPHTAHGGQRPPWSTSTLSKPTSRCRQ